ncbi:GTP cyclohydrolase II [Helicobacter enhydrae]|uniref:GTP cyclohydrolase-2 n=1 Tax=Helicobacter enhydrae TaxID=222136 RepID=A0A1B1U4B5_9HELI|nr:GTP cyclohydrolase II [Helicobacter enhydrae]ANV97562.1 GTP cyclohydrolase II [Helicobacter enhydrae]
MRVDISEESKLPTPYGTFRLRVFREYTQNIEGRECELEHLVLRSEHLGEVPLVRLHSECLTGDVLRSLKCDCGDELEMALKSIGNEGGMLLYLRQEGRGIGLFNKINAYALQDQGLDTVEANLALNLPSDARNYEIVGEIFRFFDLNKIRLLTNNPKKIELLEKYVQVERCSIIAQSNQHNQEYLQIKKTKMGHLL